MLLLLLNGILFWLIITTAGFTVCKLFFKSACGLFLQALTGLVVVTVACNCLSFFIPLNYWVVVGFFICCILLYRFTLASLRQWITALSQTSWIYLSAIPLVVLIILYTLLPPQHGDSQGYHFLTAKWFEDFKIIPGLANVHGRFGFNSSFFTTTAAFSFRHFAGQALYIVNPVIISLFYGWLAMKTFSVRNQLLSVVYIFVGIALFRVLLIGLNSPTPDAVAAILVVYIFIIVAEYVAGTATVSRQKALLIIVLAAFALTIKLSTAPLILPAVFLFIEKKLYAGYKNVLLLSVAIAVIIAPWLLRNYIISGYFIYPLPFTALFNLDWQVPAQLARYDKLLIHNGPKMISHEWEYLESLSIIEWLPLWIKAHDTAGELLNIFFLGASLLVAAVCAVRLWMSKHFSSLLVVAFAFAGVVFWLYNSPDYRFGMPFTMSLVAASLIPFCGKLQSRIAKYFALGLYVVISLAYSAKAVGLLTNYSATDFTIYPLRSHEYYIRNHLPTFRKLPLKNGVFLYVDDEDHNCINAPGPCYQPQQDGLQPEKLEMRGNTIEQGFRMRR